ncbi:MAG: transposase [Pseudomonadota bacterium]|nr:transposase [Pseudomonadota bacterium]
MDGLDCADGGRRRRWTLEEKRAVVELSLDPACSTAEVASCFDIVPARIYAWRRELREMAEAAAREDGPMFLPAVIEPAPPSTSLGTGLPAMLLEPDQRGGKLLPDAMVQVAMEVRGVPVMVAHGASATLVASVIAALQRAR